MRLIAGVAGLFCLCSFSNASFAYQKDFPRLYLWGLDGSQAIARGDLLLPAFETPHSFFYTDLQAKVGSDNEWLGSGGLGYRFLNGNKIYGTYLFLDRNISDETNDYWVLSPGVETIGCFWDARINGYYPVSKKRYTGPSFFSSCQDVVLRGHQQYAHRFACFEEIGSGADAEIGVTLASLGDLSLHGGGYYYHLQDESSIKGIAGRAELPIKNNVALTVEGSYDNQQKGAVVAGLRLQFGHAKTARCSTLFDHMYDRVTRNIGTIKTGSGIPVVKGIKDEGLFLQRDNIYFFTASGGTSFAGSATGTFENPLNADQFNNATLTAVEALTGGGNFYFSPGVYSYGATSVTLLSNQSIFGRTANYRCPAFESERARLNFSQDALAALLVTGGNNTIDSIILQNSVSGTGDNMVIALDIESAPNVAIINSEIDAIALGSGPYFARNEAMGILANNSSVSIDPTVINAIASVAGENEGFNQAIGIGSNSENNFQNNVFFLRNTTITANAISGDSLGGANLSLGIGAVLSDFINNIFWINNSTISANSSVLGTNQSFFFEAMNLSSGIGSIAGYNFNNNTFRLNNCRVTGNASVVDDNFGYNIAGGIGITLGENFDNNNFTVTNSSIAANTSIGAFNGFFDIATTIGNSSSASFANNSFELNNCINFASSLIAGNNGYENYVTSIGNALGSGFMNNHFNINGSKISSDSFVNGSNVVNLVTGIGNTNGVDFTSNNFSIRNSSIIASALVGDNLNFNLVTGIGETEGVAGEFSNNIFSIDKSQIFVSGDVAGANGDGTNASVNSVVGIGNLNSAEFVNNNFMITESIIYAVADVANNASAATNQAYGINNSATTTLNNFYNIDLSLFTVIAKVTGSNSGSNTATGLYADSGTIINFARSLLEVWH